jgi:aspartyl-tRNA(Asn)/glutamyl-tRNA(Gln) amidotransferase subunit C
MSLTPKELEKLAHLARLDLAETEKSGLASDISSILQYVGKLQELKTEDDFKVPETGPNLRADKVVGIATAEQQELIKLAPEQENNLVKTKAVFEE